MPLNSRSFLDLALLTPGATPSAGGSQVTGSNVAGARTQSNDYLIDGISNMDKQVNGGLTSFLEWKRQSLHQGDGDFLFPSIRLSGTHRARLDVGEALSLDTKVFETSSTNLQRTMIS